MIVTLNDILKQVRETSAKDNGTLADRVIKITEEVGEIASGYGTYSGYKMPKKDVTETQALDNIKEECIDTIIIALDILTRDFNMSAEEIDADFKTKMIAWEKVIERKLALRKP